jgi:hypothetical protein
MYALGDTGPGGGKIFYVSEAGFTYYQTASDTTGITAHYLEAAPADISDTKKWSSSSTYDNHDITGTSDDIGTGRRNTLKIISVDSGDNAAKACDEYSNNGKNDWFLPSKDELNQLYTNRSYVGSLNTTTSPGYFGCYYWSSSQVDDNYNCSWNQDFSSGDQNDYYSKSSSLTVRAVRAF